MSTVQDSITDNRRIAKNTILLYGRMLLMLLISLYTSRVILQTLGVVDYGLYNVVGGVISMFSFINGALSESTRRYLTFYLGKGNESELQEVFSVAVIIHFFTALVVLILGETVGLWFVTHKLVIPTERMEAALWVYHFSIAGSMIGIVSSPYNAAVVAHEKMGAFAYISILNAGLKLAMVFALMAIPFDKLKFFAVAIFLIALLIRLIYGSYCGRNFKEAHFVRPRNKNLFKNMVSLGGWSMIGILSGVLYWQGLSILLNIFFGPVINAARGIALQVQSAVWQFATNFQNALNPQITKTYACNQLDQMHNLIIRSSKFSFLLLYILCLPIGIETQFILSLWLGIVPNYATVFINFTLCIMVVESMSNSLMIAANATGKVRIYQTVVSGLQLSIVPLAYIFLKLGGAPWCPFLVHLIIMIAAMAARLFIVCPLIKMPIKKFIKGAIIPSCIVFFASLPIPMILHLTWRGGAIGSLFTITVSLLCATFAAYFLGLSLGERAFVLDKMNVFIHKFRQ